MHFALVACMRLFSFYTATSHHPQLHCCRSTLTASLLTNGWSQHWTVSCCAVATAENGGVKTVDTLKCHNTVHGCSQVTASRWTIIA
jgi:hypothetical protein